MSQIAPMLEYATPRTGSPKMPHRGLIIAIAVAVGFLEANPFADAVGFSPVTNADRDIGYVMLRIMCGVIVGFVALAFMVFLVREGRAVIAMLGRTQQKPTQAIAMTCIISGAVCLLGALAIPLYLARGTSFHVNNNGNNGAVATLDTPMLAQFLAVRTFVAGAALIGIGVLSGVGRQSAIAAVAPNFQRSAGEGPGSTSP